MAYAYLNSILITLKAGLHTSGFRVVALRKTGPTLRHERTGRLQAWCGLQVVTGECTERRGSDVNRGNSCTSPTLS